MDTVLVEWVKSYIRNIPSIGYQVQKMGDEKVSVSISKELYDKVEKKIAGTSITSVEEYIQLLLENEFPEETEYTKEEEELIRERLRRLGYIE
jgi:hypothetical protein